MPTGVQDLKESVEFLNLLLDNINSAVLIADENLQIHHFNNSFLKLFDNALDSDPNGAFGQMAGCVYAVKENKPCGETSQCRYCVLRKSLIETLLEKIPADRERFERTFYQNGEPVRKFLEYSTRTIHFQGRKMILVIIYDITAIEQQRRELERQQLQISQDLEAASQIQKSLLPHHAPEIQHVRVAWRFEPCQHVGGDIFQIQNDNPENISAYVYDVCGHGVSAAMVAMTVSQFLQSLHNRSRLTGKLFSPEDVLKRLDQAFPLDRFDCFFTIVYAALNLRSGHLKYSNAGHVPPLILRVDGSLEVLSQHGTVIGIGLDEPFGEAEHVLRNGDRVLLYTDGLTDNFDSNDDREGKTNFYQTLQDFNQMQTNQFVNRVVERANSLRKGLPPDDDMSLLAIEYIR